PYRIDLLDEEIETLRIFNPETQRSDQRIEQVKLLPGREYPLDAKGITAFRSNFRERFDIDLRQCPIYQDVSDGISSPGLEYYLALFYERLDSLFEFLPEKTTYCKIGDLATAGQTFWQDIQRRYEDRQIDHFRPILPPDDIFLTIDTVLSKLKQFRQISFKSSSGATSLRSLQLPELSSDAKLKRPFLAVEEFIENNPDHRIVFCAESAGRRETLLEVLKQIAIKPEQFDHLQDFADSSSVFGIIVAPLDQGLWLEDDKLFLITEAQLFGNRIAQRRRRNKNQSNTDFIVKSLTELRIGDAVVHLDHGVGRYRGLQTINTDGQDTEFLTLEYANAAKLYVPVAALHLISRYGGSEQDSAPLNSLGTDQWQKTKRKAAEKIRDVAAELLDIYAQREA
ncbi:MAG TPA: transcription-repair coupling factor, partial [Gammaproteobacteria bacterium]|nr:transcription-repair coupling factor [Gammaproteobacteria bacterium]